MKRRDEIIDSWKQLLTDDQVKLLSRLSPDQLEELEKVVYPNQQQEQNAVGACKEYTNESSKETLRLIKAWRSAIAEYTLHHDLKAGNRLAMRGAEANRPPQCADYILLLIPKRNREHLVGDLEEEYRTKVLPEWGPLRARFFYWEQTAIAVVCYIWPVLKRLLGLAALWKVIGK